MFTANKDFLICLFGGLIVGLCLGFLAGYKKAELEITDGMIRAMVEHSNARNQFAPPIKIPER